ncbi:MAG: LysM peptidoglycan-binding domain-containing protein [Bacteroidota bacterium]|nr:LysM peptidoglycan-binding domain-containing protein [Bacteroidota bacterium]
MKKILLLFFAFGLMVVNAQDFFLHEIVKDDTVTSLARKYLVTIHDIYQLNPKAKEGVKLGEYLYIPVNEKNKKNAMRWGKYHKVQPKETLFAIAKRYNLSVDDLKQINSNLLQGRDIQPGMDLFVPNFSLSLSQNENSSQPTRFVEEQISTLTYHIHVVQPKETLYSLKTRYGMTEEDLVRLNPQLKQGVKMGDSLRVILNEDADLAFVNSYKRPISDLVKTMTKKPRKEVVILIPFRTSKLSDNSRSVQEELKKSQLLNHTIDYYSGCLMAIDSIRKLGGNFNVKFLDSEETSSSSAVELLYSAGVFSKTDLIIGPFLNTHSEKLADLLPNKPVIAPFSKEKPNKENMFVSFLPIETSKELMLDYLVEKNQNIVAILDAEKTSSRNLIKNKLPKISIVDFADKTAADNLKALMQTDKTNYVVLDTESSAMVMRVSKLLLGLMNTYSIKLVALDRNKAYESDEVPSADLAKLNMHYPSVIKDLSVNENSGFYAKYKKEYNSFPSQYAIRGFDITFDALVRLSQEEDFADNALKIATEHLESRFIYAKNNTGGYYNAGVYILYYDNDLSIKEAK